MTSIETKLKALLNLAANASTEGEAQAAAAQAAKLAEKYGSTWRRSRAVRSMRLDRQTIRFTAWGSARHGKCS